MWSRPIPFRRKDGKSEDARWQVSQVHLAVDVANAPLALEQASRFVSRSRSRAVYEAAKSEVEQLMRAIHGGEVEDPDTLALDWDALYEDETFGDLDPFDDLVPERERDVEPTPVGERAVTIHGFGTRVSGMTFSPGGDVSMVLYDKVLQARLSGKRHMEPIWAAAGWAPGVSVTRNEARLRRKAVRELGLPHDLRPCLDDPWEFLEHQKDVFAAVVGRAESCPDATDVAWIRRVVPDEHDTNQSRWPTDPAWKVVQSATFQMRPPRLDGSFAASSAVPTRLCSTGCSLAAWSVASPTGMPTAGPGRSRGPCATRCRTWRRWRRRKRRRARTSASWCASAAGSAGCPFPSPTRYFPSTLLGPESTPHLRMPPRQISSPWAPTRM